MNKNGWMVHFFNIDGKGTEKTEWILVQKELFDIIQDSKENGTKITVYAVGENLLDWSY